MLVAASAEEGKSVGSGEWEWLPVCALLACLLHKDVVRGETLFRKRFSSEHLGLFPFFEMRMVSLQCQKLHRLLLYV